MNRIGWLLIVMLLVLGCSGDDAAAATFDVAAAISSPSRLSWSPSAIGGGDDQIRLSLAPRRIIGPACPEASIMVEPNGSAAARVNSVATDRSASAIITGFRQSSFGSGIVPAGPPARPREQYCGASAS